MRIVMIPLLSALCLAGTGCVMRGAYVPLNAVERVDVERYMGRWYEIARYPNSFQKADWVATTAEYTLRDDGRVRVVNRCRRGSLDGPEELIEGVARVVDSNTNAKLKVLFFWPFEGDYWIVGLDPDYEWAVVCEPRRRFLWILSRTPTMSEDAYADIVMRLPEQLYDPERLLRTLQPMERPVNQRARLLACELSCKDLAIRALYAHTDGRWVTPVYNSLGASPDVLGGSPGWHVC